MINKVVIKSTGFKEADRMFRALPVNVKDRELTKLHRTLARIPINEGRRRIYTVLRRLTGNTARSLGTRKIKGSGFASLGLIVVGPRQRIRGGKLAHLSEFGTVKQPATPWWRPSIRYSAPRMQKEGSERMGKSLVRTMKRHLKR